MISKRRIEEAIVNESVMRMAEQFKEESLFDDENLPLGMPDFVKDAIRQATPLALAIIRISELSMWN